MYLNNLKIIKEYRNLPIDLEIPLENITLLVGEQGCGKSSLLKLLQENNQDYINLEFSEKLKGKSVDSFFFDTEHNNPRTAPDWHYENIDGTPKGIGVSGKISTMFKSHGETLVEFTVNILKKAKNSVILLDEPEAALSIRNQYRLAKNIKNAVSKNCQLIIATHCLPLIESLDKVYDLENKIWKKSSVFIKEQRNKV